MPSKEFFVVYKMYRDLHCLLLHSDNVGVGFLLSEGLIFKKSYSSSSDQSNKAYLEDEVLCCHLLPLALQNQAKKESKLDFTATCTPNELP